MTMPHKSLYFLITCCLALWNTPVFALHWLTEFLCVYSLSLMSLTMTHVGNQGEGAYELTEILKFGQSYVFVSLWPTPSLTSSLSAAFTMVNCHRIVLPGPLPCVSCSSSPEKHHSLRFPPQPMLGCLSTFYDISLGDKCVVTTHSRPDLTWVG